MSFRCLSVVLILILAGMLRADKVTLKDGTVLEGKTIPQGDGYWFKSTDGRTRHIDNGEIAKLERGVPAGSTPGPGDAPTAASASANLALVKSKVAQVDRPAAALALWQQFLDSNPTGDDLKTAQAELARWTSLQKQGAERIKGRWIVGADLKTLLDNAGKLYKEGVELIRANQTLAGVKKLEEAQVLYPNSFPLNFDLGYVYMLQKDDAKATTYLDLALRLQPNSPEAMGNIALIQYHKKQTIEAVMTLYKAAQNGDTPEIAQDLVSLLAKLSPSQRNSDRIKPVADAANLLVAKYNLQGAGPLFLIPMRLKAKGTPGGASPGGYMTGSGFLVSADGLILTNRHVVKDAKKVTVLLDGKHETPAQVVNISSEQDLALLRVKTDHPLPFVQLSPHDSPGAGAECTVMGFPLIDRLGANIKITRGVVSSKGMDFDGADIMIDAKVNPGNSGGPILDSDGNVMAIVCMKSLSNATEDSYGLGISAGLVRKYLAQNHIDLPKGSAAGSPLTTEQIATKVAPAAVCILSAK
jgi:S1-C subfamily serine protease